MSDHGNNISLSNFIASNIISTFCICTKCIYKSDRKINLSYCLGQGISVRKYETNFNGGNLKLKRDFIENC